MTRGAERKISSHLRPSLSLLRRQEWVYTVFALRTKNEQSASSNTVNFIGPIPAYAGMTKNACARRDDEQQNKRKKMKRIIIFTMMILIAVPAVAVSVCAKDSVVTVVLDPSIGGNSYTHNNSTGTWKTVFSYGNVSGISTCVATAPSGSRGTVKTADGTHLSASGGQTSGQYCWCKMTHPMSSLWAVRGDYGSASYCASHCTDACGDNVRAHADLRGGLFGSVAAANAAF